MGQQLTPIVLATIVVGIVFYGIYRILQVGKRPADLPPGPPTIPILGNIHQIPTERPHLQFQKWAQEYGPIYSLMLGTQTMIVLSSPKTVKDLLHNRSAIYSSRPDMYLAHDVASNCQRFVTMKYGPMWRLVHKMMHNTLNIKTAVAYIPYQDLENKQMLLGLLERPDDFVLHLRRYTSSLTTQMVYGFRTISTEDPRMLQFFRGFEKWGKIAASASAQIMDCFPILRKLPSPVNPEYRSARKLYEDERKLYTSHWMDVKDRILRGTSLPCFSVDVFLSQQTEKFTDEQAAYISGSLLEGGSDTTSGTLVGFIQAMLMFPETQKAAQEEIDRVVGPDRMPVMDDAPNCTYIRSCVKETIRWMPTIILGSPHAVIQEDHYMGYRIPNGASVVNNNWTLNMDPERNPNPRKFDPSRFINDSQTEFQSATNPDENQRQNWIFGNGRRMCQGMHIAERSLFLATARIVWAFNIDKPIGPDGKPVEADIDDLVGGTTVQPNDFRIAMTPRSEKKADMIRQAWRNCEEELLDPVTKQWKKVPEGMKFGKYVPEKNVMA
ncbi:hypothetical protein AYO20_06336 [Fonsecaea nubica]|uniref:Cytochrome P450 n=1 Tax=Fonsecaea nubica TaxID=856822 RepID=A0A178CZD3_9EURO|nr:hypothetical protein AYO20_06336 [Fonsecaea nubica]OAL34493.1 hypothetical protein AYO20_06336 [Fonsecaea nubica]